MNTERHWFDRYIPWTFPAGFVVVIAVNAFMATQAVSTFTGTVVPKHYERGLQYNQVLAEAEAQRALGWQVVASWGVPSASGLPTVEVTVTDRTGQPLYGAPVVGRLVRPLEAIPDVGLTFQSIGPGRWSAVADPPKRGQWDLRLRVEQGNDHMLLSKRLLVP